MKRMTPGLRTQRGAASAAHGGLSSRGFTLIEVMLATAVLAFGLTLAIAALRAASASVRHGEAEAQRTERVRIAQQFLRRQIGAARPMTLEQDPETFEVKVFKGEDAEVQFAAPMPGYLSRGGAYLQSLTLASDGEHDRLDFDAKMLVAGKLIEENQPRPPVTLLDGISEAHFEYRGIDQTGLLSSWLPRWEFQERMPLQFRIKLTFADSASVWPPFVVALPLASAQSAPPPQQLDGQEPQGDDSEQGEDDEIVMPENDDEGRK